MESSEVLDSSGGYETWSVVGVVANVAGSDPGLLSQFQEVLGRASLKGAFSSGRREGASFETNLWFRSAAQAIDGATALFRQFATFQDVRSLSWRGAIVTGEGSPHISEHENSLLQRVRYFAHAASDGQCLIAQSTFEILKTVSLGLYGIEELGILEGSESIVGEHAFQLIGPDITGALASTFVRDASINTLPFLGGCFIGRHEEKEEISVLLRTKRLVTLLGAPGIGKSALAQRVCAELVHSSIEGVIYVDLSIVDSQRKFIEALISSFRMGAVPPANAVSKICSFMRGRAFVVLLDNADHCRADVIGFVTEALRFSGPRFIVTSKRRLSIPDEQYLHLEGLVTPPLDQEYDLEAVEQYDAFGLFLDRVRAFLPSYNPQPDLEEIVSVCDALKGNPAGIILAAQSLKRRSVAEALRAIQKHSPSQGARLGVAAASVVESLSRDARRVLASMSFLRSPWDVEDASSILDIRESRILAALPELLDSGLVSDDDFPKRYRVFQTYPREFEAYLEPKDRDVLIQRYVDHHVALVCQAVLKFQSPSQAEALASLDYHRFDIATAFEMLLRPEGSLDTFTEAMVLSWSFWYKCNRIEEALRLLDLAFRGFAKADTVQKARLLNVDGVLCSKVGLARRARKSLRQSLQIATDFNHERLMGAVLSSLATLEWSEGRPQKAVPLFERAIELQRRTGDRIGLGKHLISAVSSYLEVRKVKQAEAALDEGASILRSSKDALDRWTLCIAEGVVATAQDDFSTARSLFSSAVQLSDDLRDLASKSRALLWLSYVECRAERNELSAELLGAMRASGSQSNTQLYPTNEIRAASIEGMLVKRIKQENVRRHKFFGEICRIEDLLRAVNES